MNKPATFESFVSSIQQMEHRERLLFQTTEGTMLEIYFTIVSNFKNMFSPTFNDNINVKIYEDYNGKTEKIIYNKSSYLKYLDKKQLHTYYIMLCDNCSRIDAKKIHSRFYKNGKRVLA